MSENIGFIGIGNMGVPIATHLLRAGYRLRVYDIHPEKAEALVALGAERVEQAAQTVEPGGIVFTMLPNDAALVETVEGKGKLLQRLGTGVHVSLSTISPSLSERIAEAYARQGGSYVVATVFGRPDVAAAGRLTVALAGPAAAKARIMPLLQPFSGGRIYDFGTQAHSANVVKLIGNNLIVAVLEALASAAALLDRYDIDRMQYMQMMTAEIFNCPTYRTYGALVARDSYEPALFPTELGLKDISLILELAEQAGLALPITRMAAEHLQEAIERGWQEQDWSVIARVVAQQSTRSR